MEEEEGRTLSLGGGLEQGHELEQAPGLEERR